MWLDKSDQGHTSLKEDVGCFLAHPSSYSSSKTVKKSLVAQGSLVKDLSPEDGGQIDGTSSLRGVLNYLSQRALAL